MGLRPSRGLGWLFNGSANQDPKPNPSKKGRSCFESPVRSMPGMAVLARPSPAEDAGRENSHFRGGGGQKYVFVVPAMAAGG